MRFRFVSCLRLKHFSVDFSPLYPAHLTFRGFIYLIVLGCVQIIITIKFCYWMQCVLNNSSPVTILWQSALIASRWAQQHYTICEHATKAVTPPPLSVLRRQALYSNPSVKGRQSEFWDGEPITIVPYFVAEGVLTLWALAGFLLHSDSVNLTPQWLAGYFLFPLLPFITPNSYCLMVCSLIASAGIFIKRYSNYMKKINDTHLLV